MIDLNLRASNRIVTLGVPGKAPIKARSGSPYFYNSMELLCVTLGACFGNELITYCSRNKINPSAFESISLTMENFVPQVIIQHPPLTQEQLSDIHNLVKNCPIAKMLNKEPEVKFVENTIPVEILTDETRRSTCCGH